MSAKNNANVEDVLIRLDRLLSDSRSRIARTYQLMERVCHRLGENDGDTDNDQESGWRKAM